MSGKPYTMREMKTIVDYLTEHNAYGEIKGRKMWVDFSNSKLTSRSWQSLKETFLKRILPDITNPYYRLDIEQITSFKRGIDLTQKDKKRLEIERVDTKTKNNDGKDDRQPNTSDNDMQEIGTGEDRTCSKVVHNRASTETLILEKCYETPEDVQRDLERSTDDEHNVEKPKPALNSVKSVRDFIIYSEPLTPMLQEVLHDFATDEESSDKEPQMEIDENYVPQEQQPSSSGVTAQSQSILNPKHTANKPETNAPKKEGEENAGPNNKKSVPENQDRPAKNNEDSVFSQLEDVMVMVDEVLAQELNPDFNTETPENQTKAPSRDTARSQDKVRSSNEASSVMTDSLLPNNQEAVNANTFEKNSPVLSTNPDNNQSIIRKQSESVEIIENNDQIPANTANKSFPKLNSVNEVDLDEIRAMEVRTEEDKVVTQRSKNKNSATLNSGQISEKAETANRNKLIVHENDSDIKTSRTDSSSDLNPCLKSVSLYEEQFSSQKFSDSDVNLRESTTKVEIHKEKEVPQLPMKAKDDVILLKSHSNTDSDGPAGQAKPLSRSSLKLQKDKTIASVFGFTNGNVSRSRRSRKRTTSYRSYKHVSSDSSEWTSTSDSEYVTPPRGHRNKRSRKYLKPYSTRVMSLEEEGALFVMLGKKIYPLIKDGKPMKNLTYLPESDAEEGENFWKTKYVEEKKRTAELKKMLEENKQNGTRNSETKSPVLNAPLDQNHQRPPSASECVNGRVLASKRKSDSVEKTPEPEKTVKIKFTKYDQEVQVEGHWQHVNPVLAQVVSMFKEPQTKSPSEENNCVLLSSGNTTPRDAKNVASVEEKINQIESQIFQEIKEKDSVNGSSPLEDKLEQNGVPETTTEKESNVTIRKKRGRPKKDSTSLAQSPAKKTKSERTSKMTEVEKLKLDEVPGNTPSNSTERKTRTPRKLLDADNASTSTPQAVNGVPNVTTKKATKRKIATKSENAVVAKDSEKPAVVKDLENPVDANDLKNPTVANDSENPVVAKDFEDPIVASNLETPEIEDEDDEPRYKFPSPLPEKRQISKKSSAKTDKETAKKHLQTPIRSPDSRSHHSINSSQGYQDSDASPFNIGVKKRRRISVSALSIRSRKSQRKYRSKSYPYIVDYTSSESSNSSFSISVKSVTREQSTVNSEVYRSESYQLLLPRNQTVLRKLERISETTNEQNLSALMRGVRDNCSITKISEEAATTAKNDAGSSSNMSLPLSPELSIVENISIDRSVLLSADSHPTINEVQSNIGRIGIDDKYLISEVDVSMPLMAQQCELRKHLLSALEDISELKDVSNSAGRNLPTFDSSTFKVSTISESILSKICNANIVGSPSDSLDRRLEQLLLESAQKPNQNPQPMDIDTQVKKKGSRKRCSTPNKRKTIEKKNKLPNKEPIVEEESKATCSRSGRRSCPPSINIVYCENNAPDNLEINIHDESFDVTTVTRRKSVKKDIIKVKILRPKDKPQNKSPKHRSQKKSSKDKAVIKDISDSLANTDGDNESGVFLHGFDDSADLIHNHSETCLQIKDCLEDSVEYVEPSLESVISVGSSILNDENKENVHASIIQDGMEMPETFCENAQCDTDLRQVKVTDARSPDSGNTMYFTPLESQTNSILTEDLSDELPVPPKSQTSKWYLVSEEETNYFDVNAEDSCDGLGFGANLNHLFPITCAVPDLSTITEMSEK